MQYLYLNFAKRVTGCILLLGGIIMNKKWINVCIIIAAICLLSGCGARYAPKALTPLSPVNIADYKKSDGQVTVQAKKLTIAECREIFGDRAYRLFSKHRPYVPIQLSIENNSNDTWLLTDAMIDLPLISADDVLGRLQNSALCRALTVAGMALGSGCILTGLGGILFILTTNVYRGSSIGLAGLFGIGMVAAGHLLGVSSLVLPVIMGGNTSHENKDIREYIQKTSFGKALIIKPGHTVNVLLFVLQKHFKPNFTVTLIDQHDEQRTESFNVVL